MKYGLVFSSQTGNTKKLADAVISYLGREDCLFEDIAGSSDALQQADIVFIGSWCDKGDVTADIASYMENLRDKNVFLFGTCGDGTQAYHAQRLQAWGKHLDTSCHIVGSFMCQGQMPLSLKEHLASLKEKSLQQYEHMIETLEQGQGHPNDNDIASLCQAIYVACSKLGF